MSTKCTIAYGGNFHLYRKVLDHDHVYLQLDTTHFEAGYARVMIPIPIHIWETIRHLGGAELDLVDRTDTELVAMVEKTVDERIAEYERVAREKPDRAGFLSIRGSLVYGAADGPRETQVRQGLEYFQRERKRQRELQVRIASLRSVVRERSN